MDTQSVMRELAEKIERAANVKAAFGEPVGEGTDTVIPVARVAVRGGGGGGSGELPESEGQRKGTGKGIGLGLNVVSTPIGYIKRTNQGPEYVAIVDRNRAFLAGAVVAGMALLVLRAGVKAFGK